MMEGNSEKMSSPSGAYIELATYLAFHLYPSASSLLQTEHSRATFITGCFWIMDIIFLDGTRYEGLLVLQRIQNVRNEILGTLWCENISMIFVNCIYLCGDLQCRLFCKLIRKKCFNSCMFALNLWMAKNVAFNSTKHITERCHKMRR